MPGKPAAYRHGHRWPVRGLAALAIGLLMLVGNASALAFVCGLIVLAAALWVERLLARPLEECRAEAARTADASRGEARDLCTQSLDIWHRQLETSRGEGDAAVAELARVFAAITTRLEQAFLRVRLGDAGIQDGNDGILKAIANSGADLDGLIDMLREMQDSKAHMVREIGGLVARLRENVEEVRAIAMQTRILTLNAAIEAARAGAAGAPFAVIVGDMRQLAVRTAESSERITREALGLSDAVAAAFREGGDDGGGASVARARTVISGVVSGFHALADNLSGMIDTMEHERAEVRGEVSSALVALQFQDRVSQILAHVTQNMDALAARLSAPRSSAGNAEWFESMSRTYTTREEFANLKGGALAGAPAAANGEVTYF